MPDSQPNHQRPTAEQLLASARHRIAYPPTPDLASKLRARIEASASQATQPGSQANRLLGIDQQSALDGMAMLGVPTPRHRELAKLAVGFAAFAIVATVLALIFDYPSWWPDNEAQQPLGMDSGEATATSEEPLNDSLFIVPFTSEPEWRTEVTATGRTSESGETTVQVEARGPVRNLMWSVATTSCFVRKHDVLRWTYPSEVLLRTYADSNEPGYQTLTLILPPEWLRQPLTIAAFRDGGGAMVTCGDVPPLETTAIPIESEGGWQFEARARGWMVQGGHALVQVEAAGLEDQLGLIWYVAAGRCGVEDNERPPEVLYRASAEEHGSHATTLVLEREWLAQPLMIGAFRAGVGDGPIVACGDVPDLVGGDSEAVATSTASPTTPEPALPTPSDATALEHPAMQALIIATTVESDVTQLRKVDPTSLESLEGDAALDVTEPREAIAEHTYSYDGRYLALVIRNEAGASKKVQLVDLDAWTMTEVPIPESSAAPVMIQNRLLRFVPGSNDLLWASSRSPHELRLIRYSVASAQSATVELPDGCVPTEIYPLANDQQVAVLCSMFGQVGFAIDVMHVLVVDMATGAVTSDIRLDGVDSGSLEVTGSASDNFPVHNVTPGLAFDRQRNLLYVVPVRGEQLIVVDLSAGAIRSEVSWAPSASWLERIKGWFAPTSAQAIARAISYGYASLSPDGERLYIATASEQLTEDRRTTEEINASAFVIIDTTTLEVIQRLDLGMVRSIVPAPDGEHAIVYTAPHIFIVGDYTTTEGRALYLVNGATGEVEQELEQTGHPVRPMMSNGDNVYLELFQTDGREWLVIDANTMTVVGSNADPDATRLLVP